MASGNAVGLGEDFHDVAAIEAWDVGNDEEMIGKPWEMENFNFLTMSFYTFSVVFLRRNREYDAVAE